MGLKYLILQVRVWEIFFKLSPIIIAISAVFFYYYNLTTWSIIMYSILVFSLSVFITWWIWVIYTIGALSLILYKSQDKMSKISTEIKQIKKEIDSRFN